ncbi:MAG: hypothetical protein JWM11_6517, partial [Planctomycetaceae bacterium]|nr:hypothetical protein [Planctomycetaceae bacterium]
MLRLEIWRRFKREMTEGVLPHCSQDGF